MKYQLISEQETRFAISIYQRSIKQKREKDCFIGKDPSYRITTRTSQFTTLTDIRALLEYCLYPLFVNGDTDIPDRISKIIVEILDEDDVAAILQVVNFFYMQSLLLADYTELPFVIQPGEYKEKMTEVLSCHREVMENYKEGEFSLYRRSMYQMACGMIDKINWDGKYIGTQGYLPRPGLCGHMKEEYFMEFEITKAAKLAAKLLPRQSLKICRPQTSHPEMEQNKYNLFIILRSMGTWIRRIF